MEFEAYIFDLDGTLLDTLPDLVALTNTVLREWDMPEHTTAEIASYVGAGGRMLLARAAVPGTPDEVVDAMMARWRELYPTLGHQFTKPYPGIPEALDALKARGAKLGVLSNKFDAATQSVIGGQFPGVFHMVRGECAEIPRKPDPSGLLWMLSELGVSPECCAYVGDSGSDMEVAVNAGAAPVGVSWGYRSVEELQSRGARYLLDTAAQLVELTR